jgi:hypothetical protein
VFVSDAAAPLKPSLTTKLHMTSGGGGADGEGGGPILSQFQKRQQLMDS